MTTCNLIILQPGPAWRLFILPGNGEIRHELHDTLQVPVHQLERILVAVVLLLTGGSMIAPLLGPPHRVPQFCPAFVFVTRPPRGLMGLRDLAH